MLRSSPVELTQWLRARGRGEQAALDQLTPPVYDELRRPAHRYIRHERPGHMLHTPGAG
jgi:hypothetical protein